MSSYIIYLFRLYFHTSTTYSWNISWHRFRKLGGSWNHTHTNPCTKLSGCFSLFHLWNTKFVSILSIYVYEKSIIRLVYLINLSMSIVATHQNNISVMIFLICKRIVFKGIKSSLMSFTRMSISTSHNLEDCWKCCFKGCFNNCLQNSL